MMQGDSYGIPIEIKQKDGEVVTPTVVEDVEIAVGHIIKTFKTGGVGYDATEGKWVFILTQEESFKLPASTVKAQVRVMWDETHVEGASLGYIDVEESLSKEVLKWKLQPQ